MADYEVIPQEAIDHLTANPATAAQFEGVFGKGSAADVMAAQGPQPDPTIVSEEDESWTIIGETKRAILGGVRNTIQETGNFAEWVGNSVADGVWGDGNDIYYTDNGFEVLPREVGGEIKILGDGGIIDLPEVEANKTIVGSLGRGLTQFATGYGVFSKLTGLKGIKGMFINGALADAIVFNPDDPNLTKFAEEMGYDAGAFTEFMATEPDDPEWKNRLRNAGEGAVVGGLLEAAFWAARGLKALKAGDPKAAKEASAKEKEALKFFDDAIEEAAASVREDVKETLAVDKTLFGDMVDDVSATPKVDGTDPTAAPKADADGQLEFDLGDTPLKPARKLNDGVPKVKNRIYLTPEKIEKIKLQTKLAEGHTNKVKAAQLSMRSPRTMGDFETVLNEMAATVAVNAKDFTAAKGGDVQTWQRTRIQASRYIREMAELTGENPEAVISRFRSANDGNMANLAAEVHAQGRFIKVIFAEIRDMTKLLDDAAKGIPFDLKAYPDIRSMDELRVHLHANMELGANLLAGRDANVSNIGRALNAVKMAKQGDAQLQALLRNPRIYRDVDAFAKALSDPANKGVPPVSLMEQSAAIVKDVGDRINTFRINALLSGPGTQEVNLLANAIQALAIPLGQFSGAVVSANPKMAAHALRQLQGSVAAMLDFQNTWKAVFRALKENRGILDEFSSKVEGDDFEQVIFGNKIFAPKTTATVDKGITLPSRFLLTMDEVFKQSQYRGRVFADASAEAAEQGLKGTQRLDYIKKYLKESYAPDYHLTDKAGMLKYDAKGNPVMGGGGAAIRDDALLQARRATFTEPLDGPTSLLLQKMAIQSPIARFILPFVRTPINILSQTFQHLPVAGVISKRWRDDFAAGGVRRAQAYGRQVVGLGLVVTAGLLASENKIVGKGPTNRAVRKVWLKNNQPYSFRITHDDGTVEFVSFARLEPLSSVFGIAADLVEISNDVYEEADVVPVYQAFLMSVMENTVNKTFTQGISDASKGLTGTPDEQVRVFRNLGASFVPNFLNQTNGDEGTREVRSMTDAILARTHLYNKLDPVRDVLGEVVIRTLPKYDPVGISRNDRRKVDKVFEAITKVSLLNQSVAQNPERRLKGPNRIDLSKIQYSPTQSVYDRWLELTGTVKINGRTLREELEVLIESREYKAAAEGTIGVTERTKGARINRIIENYRQKAKSELPELQKIIRAERQGTGIFIQNQQNRNRALLEDPTALPRLNRSLEDVMKDREKRKLDLGLKKRGAMSDLLK